MSESTVRLSKRTRKPSPRATSAASASQKRSTMNRAAPRVSFPSSNIRSSPLTSVSTDNNAFADMQCELASLREQVYCLRRPSASLSLVSSAAVVSPSILPNIAHPSHPSEFPLLGPPAINPPLNSTPSAPFPLELYLQLRSWHRSCQYRQLIIGHILLFPPILWVGLILFLLILHCLNSRFLIPVCPKLGFIFASCFSFPACSYSAFIPSFHPHCFNQ